ncbi:DNA methyltransferase [Mycoplasmopsis felis]|uniref:Uncharacterized protein n=1 Tax=Mycoplasmopsis felis TaxID=33923 RepID=A0A809S8P3_9BACT|nr:site-specific DNA-methyltransferase [Mycoplasmopsis felis]BBU47514.1 hypothetical protein JPM2_2070 [Mycoplasmopsis felis]
MNKNLFEEVTELLLSNPKYVSSDNKLLKAIVYTDIINLDTNLLAMLLSNKLVKSTFFQNVNDTLVFDKQKFAWFINSKEFLPDSYTRYTNKIGLTSNGEYLSKSNNVVLDFPYKDCFLVGGQNKDDQKRDEIFYNEIIASDQISTMLSPKVFTNVKKYTEDGIQENILFNENDNLIIKGNNLIVLSSLLKRYEGKVKCIYIDPPYNTGNDSFNYNDSFNHSTWLVFMKNRLELAKRLLSEDGSIYINIDYNEVHYLKVLMDDVFGRDNFITQIIWRMGFISGYKTKANKFIRNYDCILFYSKSNNYLFNKINIPNKDFAPLLTRTEIDDLIKKFNLDKTIAKDLYNFINHDNRNEFYHLEDTWNCNKWDKLNSVAIDNSTKRIEETAIHNDSNFKGQKPEKLIQRILESSTNENDLVLDFHLGSGTTAAVAHKMNRRYIGIEQMDYIEDIAVQRLKKVIDGEQGGISKSVNWNGGRSFVYFELLENANNLISLIQNTNEDNISNIKNLIYSDQRIIPFLTKKGIIRSR